MERKGYFHNATVGMGMAPCYAGFSLPQQITFYIGKNTSFLEAGLGGTYMRGKTDESGFTKTTTTYMLHAVSRYWLEKKFHESSRIKNLCESFERYIR